MAFMTKEEMFAKYPRKWLLINEPQTRASDGEIQAGEFLFATPERAFAQYKARDLDLRYFTVISSVQEEDTDDSDVYVTVEEINNMQGITTHYRKSF